MRGSGDGPEVALASLVCTFLVRVRSRATNWSTTACSHNTACVNNTAGDTLARSPGVRGCAKPMHGLACAHLLAAKGVHTRALRKVHAAAFGRVHGAH